MKVTYEGLMQRVTENPKIKGITIGEGETYREYHHETLDEPELFCGQEVTGGLRRHQLDYVVDRATCEGILKEYEDKTGYRATPEMDETERKHEIGGYQLQVHVRPKTGKFDIIYKEAGDGYYLIG